MGSMEDQNKRKNRVRWGQRVLFVAVVFVMTAVAVGMEIQNGSEADGISAACYNSAECMAAVEAEKQANENATMAQNTSNMYQNKVNELNMQIASTERVIAETEAQVEALNVEIKVTEQKLSDEQEALAELLVNMHFEGDAEPITILAGSVSISDLAEKQARNEVVKQQISATATKVRKAKEKLEADKAEVEDLLESQKQMKISLAASREEQQQLVAKYANDAAAYEQAARAAIDAQREAELAEIARNPDLYRGGSYSGFNTYEWQNRCPQENLGFTAYLNGDWRYPLGAGCQCTSYAGWKVWDVYRIAIDWGYHHAYDWGWVAASNTKDKGGAVTRVDHTPEANSMGQSSEYPFGHVWWVESVNSDGSVNITEYNNPYATCLYQTGGDLNYCGWHYNEYPSGDFGSRTMTAAQAAQYNYIHFR